MPDNNGDRTTNEWLIHIDSKLTAIDDKLDTKVDKNTHERLEDRVGVIADKTNNLAVKQAGIAGLASGVGIWLKSQFFS